MEWILEKLFAAYDNSKSANTFWREWNGMRYSAHPFDKLAYLSDRYPVLWKLAKTALELMVIVASSLFGVWLAGVTISG